MIAARPLSSLLLALIALGALGAPARGEIVRLNDGTLVHCEIVDFDEAAGITVRRVDTGGRLSLRWDHMPASEVKRIRASRGFTGEEPEPWLVDVVHLVLRNGTTESGMLLDGPSDVYVLQRKTGVDSFPRNFVKTVETGKAEGLEFYRPEALYAVMLEELGQPVDALGHFELARACEGAGLYERARDHYAAVREFDPEFKQDLIPTRLARVEIKIEDAEETAVLDDIRNRLYRKDFELALAMVAQFRDDYPGSRQRNELDGLEGEIRSAKRAHHGRAIVSDYFSKLERRLAYVARDEGMTLDVAQEIAQTETHDAIVDELADDYQLTIDTVQELWDARRGGSPRSAFYGSGTFILGKDKALEFGRFEDDEDDESAVVDGEVEAEDAYADIVEKVKKQREARAAEQRGAGRGGAAVADEGPDPDEWWDAAPREDRIKWLTAWYAEFGGQLKVLEARGRDCRTCDARGYVETFNEDGELERLTCPTCKDIKFERLVKFR